ncbi:hypothetical protein [Paenochrobactrum pullorum]|uniref:hypothetical protein n=1 Tax=Paenochrobactrum pullorum TaxID=1324351 RepID=UPI0035BC2C42
MSNSIGKKHKWSFVKNILSAVWHDFLVQIKTRLPAGKDHLQFDEAANKDCYSENVELPICPQCLDAKRLFSCARWPDCGCPDGTRDVFCQGKTVPCQCVDKDQSHRHSFSSERLHSSLITASYVAPALLWMSLASSRASSQLSFTSYSRSLPPARLNSGG